MGGAMTERSRRWAVVMLLGVTLIWGFTFLWMKQALGATARHLGRDSLTLSVGLFMTARFGLSAVLLPALLPGARRGLADRGLWRGAAVLALILLLGFALQLFGLAGVSPAVSAFLTSLYVVFTALLGRALSANRVGPWLVVGALLATYGAATISGPPTLTFGVPEWLTVGCALVFAMHILATDRYTRRHAPLPLSVATYVWVTLGSAVLILAGFAGAGEEVSPGSLRTCVLDSDFVAPVLWSSVLGTVVALTLMNQFQRQLSPVRAAVLYALEPVWTAVFAVALRGAEVDAWLLFGGLSLILGNLVAELGPRLAGRLARSRGSA